MEAGPEGALSLSSKCATIVQVIVALALFVTRIDRRPSLKAEDFRDVYFLEVQDDSTEQTAEHKQDSWVAKLDRAVERVKVLGGIVDLLGFWDTQSTFQ